MLPWLFTGQLLQGLDWGKTLWSSMTFRLLSSFFLSAVNGFYLVNKEQVNKKRISNHKDGFTISAWPSHYYVDEKNQCSWKILSEIPQKPLEKSWPPPLSTLSASTRDKCLGVWLRTTWVRNTTWHSGGSSLSRTWFSVQRTLKWVLMEKYQARSGWLELLRRAG